MAQVFPFTSTLILRWLVLIEVCLNSPRRSSKQTVLFASVLHLCDFSSFVAERTCRSCSCWHTAGFKPRFCTMCWFRWNWVAKQRLAELNSRYLCGWFCQVLGSFSCRAAQHSKHVCVQYAAFVSWTRTECGYDTPCYGHCVCFSVCIEYVSGSSHSFWSAIIYTGQMSRSCVDF